MCHNQFSLSCFGVSFEVVGINSGLLMVYTRLNEEF